MLIPMKPQLEPAFDPEYSCVFTEDSHFNRTWSVEGDRRTWTFSTWIEPSFIDTAQDIFHANQDGNDFLLLEFNSTSHLRLQGQLAGATSIDLVTTAEFIDASAFIHLLVVMDTTESTAADRTKIYINGNQVTAFSTETYPSASAQLYVNDNIIHYIGRNGGGLDGQLCQIHFVDGFALGPEYFGFADATRNDVWMPRNASQEISSYGDEGFYLSFDDDTSTTTLGNDSSGNANNWSNSGMATTDQTISTPYNTYCVLSRFDSNSAADVFNGGFTEIVDAGTAYRQSRGTYAYPRSGKWYFEGIPRQAATEAMIGCIDNNEVKQTYVGAYPEGYGYWNADGNTFNDTNSTAYGDSYTTDEVIGVLVDMDALEIRFYNTNVDQGLAYTLNAGVQYMPCVSTRPNAGDGEWEVNFGAKPFVYSLPSGYLPLCTANFPTPDILHPACYFDVKLYTGDNGADRAIDGIKFQPDFALIKNRDQNNNFVLFDSERTVGDYIRPDVTNGEVAGGGSPLLDSFNTDGITISYETSDLVNATGDDYVAWLMKASPLAGFEIITFSGSDGGFQTVNHSLGVAPSMILMKQLDATEEWKTFHKHIEASAVGTNSEDYSIPLDSTAARSTTTDPWEGYRPTTTDFRVDTTFYGSTDELVAYVFAEIPGFSRFGYWLANGSTLPALYMNCGFRPRFIMVKRASATGNWVFFDLDRDGGYNNLDTHLWADATSSEATGTNTISACASGWAHRDGSTNINATGTYIYAAFADQPLNFARGI